MKNNSNLIKEIRVDLLNQKIKLSSILRKAKVLAAKLKNDRLKNWVDSELNGYSGDNVEIPKYRKLHLENMGHFSGPFQSGLRNARIPITSLPDIVKEFANDSDIPDSIASLESSISSMSSNSKGALQIQWPADLIRYAQHKATIYENMVLVDAWKIVGPNQLDAIIDKVRNKLLDLILELEEQYPENAKSEDKLKDIPNESITQYVTNNIYGDKTQIASGTNINQTMHINVYNDIKKLRDEFEKVGIPKEDIDKLILAIDEDGPIQDKNIGIKVSDWIGKITSKVLRGTVTLAQNTTVAIISELILRYYGL